MRRSRHRGLYAGSCPGRGSLPRAGARAMPELIRRRCGVDSHPSQNRFGRACIALVMAVPLLLGTVRAEAATLGDYLDAIAALEGHEAAALTLTLGVILFAVATAIALLRTR